MKEDVASILGYYWREKGDLTKCTDWHNPEVQEELDSKYPELKRYIQQKEDAEKLIESTLHKILRESEDPDDYDYD